MASLREPKRAPRALFLHRGHYRPRRWGWVLNFNRVACPERHRVRFHRNVREDGFLECPARGALLYAYVPPAFGGVRRFWAADVSEAERDWFNDRGLTFTDVVRYLGAEFPESGAA